MLIILAHKNPSVLQSENLTIVTQVKRFGTHCWVEHGHVLRQGGGTEGIRMEHFGYAEDGASQPLFFQQELDEEKQTRGIDRWNPGAGPRLILTQDPLGKDKDYGSYLVFRKLKQDVHGFEKNIEVFAKALQVNKEEAAARVVGRYRDGRSLIPATTPLGSPRRKPVLPNNFLYDTDWKGQHCPFHAHIRRMNPRWETNSAEYDRRIARRSISYGTLEEAKAGKEVGLLFMCYQQSLENQFEALQGEWAYTPKALPPTGYDGLIGRKLPEPSTDMPQWHIPEHATEAFIGGCVTPKGGEYFFAPSLRVLLNRLKHARL
jgi:Dyp-type peroxidase family